MKAPPKYRPFAVTGLEIEYPIVGEDFRVLRLAPAFLESIGGPGAADAKLWRCGVSNEFVDHVIEIKNVVPRRRLVDIEMHLHSSVQDAMIKLQGGFGASLLPVAMHPWMKPDEAGLWPGEGREIYRAYSRLFDVYQHGWLNVQSCHVNLPFGSERSCSTMVTASALLVPYLPVVAAASPFLEGRATGALDQRLVELKDLQGRVPESRGVVVPEYMESYEQYRKDILEPMYAAVDRLDDAACLRADFFNSRGVVLKFARASMEIRVLDIQECVQRDVAIAAFCRAALRGLMELLRKGGMELPDHSRLVRDYHEVIVKGRKARVGAPHLGGPASGKIAVLRLLDIAREAATQEEIPYLLAVQDIADHGSLAERMLRALGVNGPVKVPRPVLMELCGALQSCLSRNEPF